MSPPAKRNRYDPELEEKLARLRSLGEAPEANHVAIAEHLADRNNYVVARAAELIGEAGLQAYETHLVDLYPRFESEPVKRDPGCKAKLAIVDALNLLGAWEEALFLRAARQEQLEPSWGPPVDTAANLRVSGASGLARISSSELLFEAARLLMDPEPIARTGAVGVLEYFGSEGSELLLRMKVLGGDEEGEVVAEAFAALMRLAPERSLEFVSGWLDHEEGFLAESAALALGESRLEAAYEILRLRYVATLREEDRAWLLLPMALTRLDVAVDFLLERIVESGEKLAEDALDALRLYASDDAIVARLEAAVDERASARLERAFRAAFV